MSGACQNAFPSLLSLFEVEANGTVSISYSIGIKGRVEEGKLTFTFSKLKRVKRQSKQP